MERTDKDLIEAYKSGEEKALALLVGRYASPLYYFVSRFVPENDDAEDIVQDSFVKAWKHLKRFDTSRSFKTWLFSIGKNTSLDWIKKKKPAVFSDFENEEHPGSFADTIADVEPLPPEIFRNNELAALFDDAISKLSPAHAIVLHMHYRQELSFEEIGEILETPLETVRSRHHRGREKLREIMGDKLDHKNL